MARINVNRTVDDPFYRYKMPKLFAKVEGKGNGIKTVIVNMTEIAKALERPPTYPTKYFGCELGAQTQVDTKNERYIVNGEHDSAKLQDILDGFIKKYVLCPGCDNPETVLQKKGKDITQSCKACGHKAMIDPKHRLTTFILKNPPPKPQDHNGARKDSPTQEEAGEVGLGDFDAEEPMKNGNGSENGVDDDDDWASDGDQQNGGGGLKLSGAMAALTMNADMERPLEERLDMLHKYFTKAKETNSLMKDDGKAMLQESERLDLKTKAPLILCNVLLDENALKQIATYKRLLQRFTAGDKKAQRYALGGVEQVIERHESALLPRAAHVIKAMYDEDICEEDTLLEWGKKPSRKYVKKELSAKIIEGAQPVLKWLEEADEESSDDEAEVEFDDRARQLGTVEVKKNAAAGDKAAPRSAEKDDDFDIDDI